MAFEKIVIKKALIEEKQVLSNLMQLYLFELNKYNNSDLNNDGFFEYEYFNSYWDESSRYPFLFYYSEKLAGFVLVNSYSVLNHENTKSIAEFFVLPIYRKMNIGKYVAFKIFNMFPSNWQVCEMTRNKPAIDFWRKIVREYTDGDFEEVLLNNDKWNGPVQIFNNETILNL